MLKKRRKESETLWTNLLENHAKTVYITTIA